ncbi:MAG: hypothetical protein AABN95_17990 [Acidobacteriota bacterium]
MQIPPIRLVHALIGKSVAETLLVGGLAIFAFITILPPYFHGWGEVTESGIAGWAVNNAAPWDRVEVQLYIDGQFIATQVANRSRPDVQNVGWAKDEWHGYAFSAPSVLPGSHEARLYALHSSGSGARKSLQLLGDPISFFVDENGRLVRPPSQ